VKVNLRVLKRLLENRPKPRLLISQHAVSNAYYPPKEIDKWFEEFTKAFNEFEKQLREKSVTVRVFNDTDEPLKVKIVSGLKPALVTVQPQKQIAVFMRSNILFFKIWNNNMVMFKEVGENEAES
jgi:hypothetical protein